MSSASATSNSLEKSAAVVPPATANRPQLLEDLTRKFAKIQGLEILSVLGMFEDDADDQREQNRQVRQQLLGKPESAAGDDMGNSRRTILADNITINCGSEQPPQPAPAPQPTTQPQPLVPPQVVVQPQTNGMSTAAKIGAGAIGAASLLGLGAGAGYLMGDKDPVPVVTQDPLTFEDKSATIRPYDPLTDK